MSSNGCLIIPPTGPKQQGELHNIQQGTRGVAEYTLEFRTLAADSGWDDSTLWSAYRRGLSEEMKDLLVRDSTASSPWPSKWTRGS